MEFAKPLQKATEERRKQPAQAPQADLTFDRIDVLSEIAELSAGQRLYQDPRAARLALATFTPPHDPTGRVLSTEARVENAEALEAALLKAQATLRCLNPIQVRDLLKLLSK